MLDDDSDDDESLIESREVRPLGREVMTNSVMCRGMTRMGPEAFYEFCGLLVNHCGLQSTKWVHVEEQVVIFLYILGHATTNREVQRVFGRSGPIISRHFHNVLRAVIELEDLFMKQPDGLSTPAEIHDNPKLYPYFKDCVGAIDGTHVRVKVSASDAPRYRGKKGYTTQNVLAACTFDLKFTYVLAGWEGSASDARIFKDALRRQYSLKIPHDKYYLGDAGFPMMSGLIPPYKGERYHLKEYSHDPPRTHRELFNLRHSYLRNAIERTFGVVKRRFPIMASANEPQYDVRTHTRIVLACCIVHNFLMGVDPDEDILRDVDQELADGNHGEYESMFGGFTKGDCAIEELVRDSIAMAMWRDYIT